MPDISFTGSRIVHGRAKFRRLRLLIFVGATMLQSTLCQAGSYLLITSGEGEIYHRFQNALDKKLKDINPENTLVTQDIATFDANPAPGNFDVVVSAGIEAGEAITKSGIQKQVLMSMLPEASYQKLSASGSLACDPSHCRVIYLDQPVDRQLKLIKAALPDARMITVIGSAHSSKLREQIMARAPKFGFQTKNIFAGNETELLNALQDELAGTDVLMAIPDPIIYNSTTARAILLSTFNQRIPLYAYSRSFIRAGATFGIYSNPEEIARQVADLLCCIGNIKARNLYPKYFTIDINQHTTEALGISIQNAASLKQALTEDDKK